MRGRKPKPTQLKVITGNPGGRDLPKNEPAPRGKLPDAPENLSDEEKKVWAHIKDVAGAWLTEADAMHVELTSKLMVEARTDFKGMVTTRMALLARLCGSLGLTPADRARISAPKAHEDDPSEAFFAGNH